MSNETELAALQNRTEQLARNVHADGYRQNPLRHSFLTGLLDIVEKAYQLGQQSQGLFTREAVSAAVNRAADFMRDSIDYECEETIRQQTYGDLIVNLGLSWLDNPDATPEEIAESSWQEPLAKVLSWAGIGDYEDEEEDEDDPEPFVPGLDDDYPPGVIPGPEGDKQP